MVAAETGRGGGKLVVGGLGCEVGVWGKVGWKGDAYGRGRVE